jgi:predicted lipoprotein with Yx(FWY)xxD motif
MTPFHGPDTPVPQLGNPTCANDLWPALLTKGAPIAGPGVDKHLLKTVARNDVIPGEVVHQVTYAGQPLYFFFQDENPGETDGANLFDNVVDPTGVWYLVGASGGRVAPGTALLQSEGPSSNGGTGPSETVLAATMNDGFGDFPDALFPVYTFSNDSGDTSACTGKCAVYWPPVLTSDTPQAGSGVDESKLGSITRPDRTQQVTYDGQPLYLFAGDAYIPPLPPPFNGPGGINGDGVNAFGGMFNAIPLP